MYSTQALKQFKNMWNKDEEMFTYCMNLLKSKLDKFEYYQFYIYYYIYNQNFEKAVEYISVIQEEPSLNVGIEFYDSDDFFSDICECMLVDACCDESCDCCNDCCSCDECCECCGEGPSACQICCCFIWPTACLICGVKECCCG